MQIGTGAALVFVLSLGLPGAARSEARDTGAEVEVAPSWGHNWFWVDTNAGYDVVALRSVDANIGARALDVVSSRGGGPSISAGLGLRLVFFTLGLRGHVTMLQPDMQGSEQHGPWLWRVGPEIGFRVQLGRLEPTIALSAGYATFGGTTDVIQGLDRGFAGGSFDGLFGGVTLGLSVFVTKEISLGGAVVGNLLMLSKTGEPVQGMELVDTSFGGSFGGSIGAQALLRIHL